MVYDWLAVQVELWEIIVRFPETPAASTNAQLQELIIVWFN